MATVSDSWRRSSFCSSHTCIELRRVGPMVEIQGGLPVVDVNRIDANGLVHFKEFTGLAFADEEWAAFVAGVKAGEFDDLAAP